jgi:hypothetical protein
MLTVLDDANIWRRIDMWLEERPWTLFIKDRGNKKRALVVKSPTICQKYMLKMLGWDLVFAYFTSKEFMLKCALSKYFDFPIVENKMLTNRFLAFFFYWMIHIGIAFGLGVIFCVIL